MPVVRNVKFEKKGTDLVIRVDLSKNLGPSKSGKMNLVASSGGLTPLPNDDDVMVNVVVAKFPDAQ